MPVRSKEGAGGEGGGRLPLGNEKEEDDEEEEVTDEEEAEVENRWDAGRIASIEYAEWKAGRGGEL